MYRTYIENSFFLHFSHYYKTFFELEGGGGGGGGYINNIMHTPQHSGD